MCVANVGLQHWHQYSSQFVAIVSNANVGPNIRANIGTNFGLLDTMRGTGFGFLGVNSIGSYAIGL